jgi:hypothetical protein
MAKSPESADFEKHANEAMAQGNPSSQKKSPYNKLVSYLGLE